MKTKLLKKDRGFTIVEVLIVLAIAGLILLIVFLAVPALQRNSRNTGRRSDVARIGGGVNEYVSNNNGAIPTTVTQLTTIVSGLGALNQFAIGDHIPVSGTLLIKAQATALPGPNPKFSVVGQAKCDQTNVGNTVDGNAKQMAIRYSLETSGGVTPACIDI